MEFKDLVDKFIKIVEDAKGVQNVVEQELKKYFEINKTMLEDFGQKISTKVEDAMAKISDPNNLEVVMGKMIEIMTSLVGEANVKKLMELQQKYPYLQQFTQSFSGKK